MPRSTRPIRLVLTVIALLAATALAPAAAGAAPNQGTGGSDSDYCSVLRDRLQRYHDIAADTRQPARVRDFYRGRAAYVLYVARNAGCSWASPAAVVSGATAPQSAATASRLARFERLTLPRRTARAATHRRAATGTGRPPVTQPATVAAVKAHPTGNAKDDAYCAAVSRLIDEAHAEGDNAALNGDQASADAWYELADTYIDRATQNGCRFVFAITAGRGAHRTIPSATALR